jgi:signal peptidase
MPTRVYKSRRHNRLGLGAFLLLSLVSIGGLALWRMPSVQLMTVESGSMTPAIRKGDAVVLRPVASSNLKVGDVVSYRSPADQSVIITHRIVEVEKTWKQVITKGDNVSRNDKPLPMSEIIGRVDLRVAYLGFALGFLRTPAGLIACVYLPALLIVGLELKRLAVNYTKHTYRLVGYSKHS